MKEAAKVFFIIASAAALLFSVKLGLELYERYKKTYISVD